jgi:hypothetical protein
LHKYATFGHTEVYRGLNVEVLNNSFGKIRK